MDLEITDKLPCSRTIHDTLYQNVPEPIYDVSIRWHGNTVKNNKFVECSRFFLINIYLYNNLVSNLLYRWNMLNNNIYLINMNSYLKCSSLESMCGNQKILKSHGSSLNEPDIITYHAIAAVIRQQVELSHSKE